MSQPGPLQSAWTGMSRLEPTGTSHALNNLLGDIEFPPLGSALSQRTPRMTSVADDGAFIYIKTFATGKAIAFIDAAFEFNLNRDFLLQCP